MNNVHNPNDEEANLRELAAALLSEWKYIAVSCAICVSLSVLYAVNVKPTFDARAVFELKSSGGAGIPSEYSGLASMAGISLGDKKSKGVFDRLVGRDFILRLSSDVNLVDDPYFNPQDDASFFSLARIKSALGMIAEDDVSSDTYDDVVLSYAKSVKVRETKNGSIEVTVTHPDAKRSAIIANAIVARVVRELSEEEKSTQSEELAYLSERLADALSEMEATKKSVADFALANSLSSPSALAARSELMFELREDLRRTKEMAVAVGDLSKTMSSPATLTHADYAHLKITSPIIDDVDFRRLIGVPEALDAWSWPPKERLGDFQSTLADRIARIERSIQDFRKEAEIYASSSERLATLQREATVSEATYNVLIEQVKAQSLIAGYQGETALFYQSATPPEIAAAPKKKLIVALGIAVGLIIGAMIAVVAALRGGRVYTEQAIIETSGASSFLKSTSLAEVSYLETSAALEKLSSSRDPVLNEIHIAQSVSSSKVTLVGSTAPSVSPLAVALWLGIIARENGKKVAVVSLDGKAVLPVIAANASFQNLANIFDLDGVDIILPKNERNAMSMMASHELHGLLSQGDKRYDLVIVASSHDQTSNSLRAFSSLDPFSVILAKPAVTLRKSLETLRQIKKSFMVVGC